MGLFTEQRILESVTITEPRLSIINVIIDSTRVIKSFDIYVGSPVAGGSASEARFNVRRNGIALFTSPDFLIIPAGSKHGELTGLSIAVDKGDLLSLDYLGIAPSNIGSLLTFMWTSEYDVSLDDLLDVNASSPSDGDVLIFDSGTDLWIPTAVAGTTSIETIVEGTGITVDATDPFNPEVAVDTSVIATKSYADSLVTGLLDDRGNYDASGNAFPSSGGSGSAGTILKGDLWTISVASAGNIGSGGAVPVQIGDIVRALVNTPGNTPSNWAITEHNYSYTPENQANKDIDGTLAANSDTNYPSQKAVKTYADTKVPSTYLDTDGTLAANSDSKVATQKATKTYADTKVAGPGTVTSGNLVKFSGTTGKAIGEVTAPSGAVVGTTDTQTLTGKTIDFEAAGNVITVVEKLWIPVAGTNGTTPAPVWDLPASGAPTATDVTGTNIHKGVLSFADSGLQTAQMTLLLPDDWVGAIDIKLVWYTTATTGNCKWFVSTAFTGTGGTATDDPAFNTAQSVTTAAPGTTLRITNSAVAGLTNTGSATGALFHIKIGRDGTDGSDTIGAAALLIGAEITWRRTV